MFPVRGWDGKSKEEFIRDRIEDFHNLTHMKEFESSIHVSEFRACMRGLADACEYMKNCTANKPNPSRLMYRIDRERIREIVDMAMKELK